MSILGRYVIGYLASHPFKGHRKRHFSRRAFRGNRLSRVMLLRRPIWSQKISNADTLSCILMLLALSLLTTAVLGFFGTQAVLGTGNYSIIELLRGFCC
jgi:hypothetical protein